MARSLIELQRDHPLRLAVDGITAAGKTTLADELSVALTRQGRTVIRIRMDDFHHVREHRHRQGRESARGYYDDAFDFASLHQRTLKPLGSEGDRRYCRRIIDLASDTVIDEPSELAAPDSVLVADGSFMQRHHRGDWDCVIFVNTSFDEALRRGVERDGELLGGNAAATARYTQRYHAAAHMHVDEVDPVRTADIVVDNDEPAHPELRSNRRG